MGAPEETSCCHRDDVAVQATGVPLQKVALAHIDSRWVYPGGGDYSGLLVEADLTAEAFARTEEVKSWIKQAAQTLVSKAPPAIDIGAQCEQPFACGFYGCCSRDVVQPTHPVHWLPRIGAKA